MKVAILTQYFPPEVGAAQSRLAGLARRLAERQHDVYVLAPMPSYPQGRIYPGYGGVLRREERDGVRIIRTFVYATRGLGWHRMASYLSFALSAILPGATALPRLDYLITQSPPLLLGPSGYLLSRLTGGRWVFNVSDLWPESGVRLGALHAGAGLRLARALEAFCYRQAWLVTGQSHEILQDITARFPGRASYYLPSGVDTEQFSPAARSARARQVLAPDGRCIAIYVGLHGVAQGLDQVVEAAALLQRQGGLGVVFVGDGLEKDRLIRRGAALGLTNVRFLPPRPHEEVPALLASADIALVPLRCHIPGAVPSKLYEAMAAGLPVVLAADGEAAQIVREADAGVVVRPGDPAGLARALRDLAERADKRQDLGRRARQACEAQFSRKAILDRFIDFLEAHR